MKRNDLVTNLHVAVKSQSDSGASNEIFFSEPLISSEKTSKME